MKKSYIIQSQSYWDSPKAIVLFQPNAEEKVLMAIGQRVQIIRSALTTPDCYLSVIEDTIEENNKLVLANYNKFTIHLKSKYLLTLYETVELEMPTITFT